MSGWCRQNMMLRLLVLAGIGVAAGAHAAGGNTKDKELEKRSDKELAEMEVRAEEARALYSSGDYDDAAAIFEELALPLTVSQPLYRCELATCLLALGDEEKAQTLFLDCYHDLLEFFDPKSEKKAAGVWGAEVKKVYKGEPYEQATLCLMLGVLFLKEGDVDNALACFKSGQIADSDVEDEEYRTDYSLLQFLESLCYRLRQQPNLEQQLAQTGVSSFKAIAGEEQDVEYIAPMMSSFNTLLLVMSGESPYMTRRGEYGEERVIVIESQSTNRYEVLLDDKKWHDALQGLGDINFQAATRGGREMDNVLKKHAKTKHATSEAGDAMLDMGSDVGGAGGLAVMGIGLIIKGISASMNAAADIRCWQTLPGSIQVLPLNLSAGMHEFDVHAFKGYQYSHCKTLQVDIQPQGLNIVFVFPK
jgi:tetratricopeptide (TPR) repeat protein